MPFELPQAQDAAAGWQLADYGFERHVTPAAAAAGATIQTQLDTVPDGEIWELERVAVTCNSTTATACALYDSYIDPGHLLDQTPAGNQDIGDELNPIRMRAGVTLLIVWTNASAGAIGTATVQWSVLRKAG